MKEEAPGTESIFPRGEVTGVHTIDSEEPEPMTPRDAYAAFLEREEIRIERKVFRRESPDWNAIVPPKPSKTLYLSKRVLRQYVRRVLRHDKGLEDYLRGKTEEALRGESYDLYDVTYNREFDRVVAEARVFAAAAEDSERTTRKGYLIHRIERGGERYVVTLHHQQSVVVGIYTQTQFDRKCRHTSGRIVSHHRAQAYRKSKPVRLCR